jgi:nucleoside-diphosphate-sugar epimerase
MKIIGDGLLAKQFIKHSYEFPEVLIFASGVSDSAETRRTEFQREFQLLQEATKSSHYIVYFSTISCLDKSKISSDYIRHKLKIESYIRENYERFLVLRLPNVIGPAGNPNNLINYFKDRIREGDAITVEKASSRYFLDVAIIPLICMSLLEKSLVGMYHVCPDRKYKVLEVVDILAELIGVEPDITVVEKGNSYVVSSDISNLIETNLNVKLNRPLGEIIKRYL